MQPDWVSGVKPAFQPTDLIKKIAEKKMAQKPVLGKGLASLFPGLPGSASSVSGSAAAAVSGAGGGGHIEFLWVHKARRAGFSFAHF